MVWTRSVRPSRRFSRAAARDADGPLDWSKARRSFESPVGLNRKGSARNSAVEARSPCVGAAFWPLLAALADAPRQGLTILTNSAGKTWTEHGFRSSWRKACARAGITGVTFHDLRGTAVTRLALAECTVPQIAAITGHSLSQAQTILHTHYLGGGAELAEEAMRKLETRTQTVKLPVKP